VSSATSDAPDIDLSIVIPVRNEAEGIAELLRRTAAEVGHLGKSFEIIVVDDGSADRSFEIVSAMAAGDSRVRVLQLRRNFGQTAAMVAGFDHARGRVVVPMDGDGQNDPADIGALLAKLEQGYDVVSGWRKDRRDAEFGRRLPSALANRLISWATGVALNDYGCTLKAYRRDVLKGIRLYGEMHRFIPVYASWEGARIAEIEVRHHPRAHGRSNYGFERTIKIVLDLLVLLFLERYAAKPIYVFGGFGLASIAAAFLAGGYAVYLKYFQDRSFITTPLPLITIFLFAIGITALLTGLLAEMIMRTYHESQGKPPYSVKSKVNL
jgi:glycosyltransferase involved in cell wall biosynthesis